MWKLVSTYVETKLKGFYARGKLNSLSIGLKALNCIAWGRVTEGNPALGRRCARSARRNACQSKNHACRNAA